MTPEATIQLLNDYFELVAEPITQPGGTIVNFIGDGVHAAFDVPVAQSDHAARALRAAGYSIFLKLHLITRLNAVSIVGGACPQAARAAI